MVRPEAKPGIVQSSASGAKDQKKKKPTTQAQGLNTTGGMYQNWYNGKVG